MIYGDLKRRWTYWIESTADLPKQRAFIIILLKFKRRKS